MFQIQRLPTISISLRSCMNTEVVLGSCGEMDRLLTFWCSLDPSSNKTASDPASCRSAEDRELCKHRKVMPRVSGDSNQMDPLFSTWWSSDPSKNKNSFRSSFFPRYPGPTSGAVWTQGGGTELSWREMAMFSLLELFSAVVSADIVLVTAVPCSGWNSKLLSTQATLHLRVRRNRNVILVVHVVGYTMERITLHWSTFPVPNIVCNKLYEVSVEVKHHGLSNSGTPCQHQQQKLPLWHMGGGGGGGGAQQVFVLVIWVFN